MKQKLYSEKIVHGCLNVTGCSIEPFWCNHLISSHFWVIAYVHVSNALKCFNFEPCVFALFDLKHLEALLALYKSKQHQISPFQNTTPDFTSQCISCRFLPIDVSWAIRAWLPVAARAIDPVDATLLLLLIPSPCTASLAIPSYFKPGSKPSHGPTTRPPQIWRFAPAISYLPILSPLASIPIPLGGKRRPC